MSPGLSKRRILPQQISQQTLRTNGKFKCFFFFLMQYFEIFYFDKLAIIDTEMKHSTQLTQMSRLLGEFPQLLSKWCCLFKSWAYEFMDLFYLVDIELWLAWHRLWAARAIELMMGKKTLTCSVGHHTFTRNVHQKTRSWMSVHQELQTCITLHVR